MKLVMMCVALVLVVGCGSSPSQRIASLPDLIDEQEGANYTSTWVLDGMSYDATWSNGAAAVITVDSFTAASVALYRTDTADSFSAGLTAVYTGTFEPTADGGGTIDNGAVTWTFAGGTTASGSWSANW